MTTEGEYLILVNDLKQQYDAMKEQYEQQIRAMEAKIEELEEKMYRFHYTTETQFESMRPSAEIPVYSNQSTPLALSYCMICDFFHPLDHCCYQMTRD